MAAPRSIPFGNWVRIRFSNGVTIVRRVEDRLARRYDDRFDVFFPDHKTAVKFGTRTARIEVIR